MTPVDAIEIARDAILVSLKVGMPVMLVSLMTGLVISLVQALTQIQEMTLVFVPKILVMFLSIMVLLPFMLTTMTSFAETLFARIVTLN